MSVPSCWFVDVKVETPRNPLAIVTIIAGKLFAMVASC
jgi:hypothetical protein